MTYVEGSATATRIRSGAIAEKGGMVNGACHGPLLGSDLPIVEGS